MYQCNQMIPCSQWASGLPVFRVILSGMPQVLAPANNKVYGFFRIIMLR